jgi:hypothetical protein
MSCFLILFYMFGGYSTVWKPAKGREHTSKFAGWLPEYAQTRRIHFLATPAILMSAPTIVNSPRSPDVVPGSLDLVTSPLRKSSEDQGYMAAFHEGNVGAARVVSQVGSVRGTWCSSMILVVARRVFDIGLRLIRIMIYIYYILYVNDCECI